MRYFLRNYLPLSRNLKTSGFYVGPAALVTMLLLVPGCKHPAGALHGVSFSPTANTVEAYDFVEIIAKINGPRPRNPFTDASLTGHFESMNGRQRWDVEGFCDAEDGAVFRVRFMPPASGEYKYSVQYRQGNDVASTSGTFHATEGHRRGPIRVDPQYPWHFIWEGTREHYFFNGTTAFWLLGWKDESTIRDSIERLHRLKINRLRVTIAGRTDKFYGDPVMVGDNWTVFLTPWPGQQPEDIYHPGFDYSRFNLSFWQKFERMLRFARDRDMIISLILDMNDSRIHPDAGSEDEHRFIRYAVARFAAFSNITWDLGDDLDQYRDVWWTHRTGTLLKNWDPYHHLATSHPVFNGHQDRTSDWFDFTSFQEWSRDQHSFMLKQRQIQKWIGRVIPQTNEEYGYEDHYPLWSMRPPAESGDTLRRTAWDISMAGGYQTTGETARRGTNIWPDTGGGWMNGRGDDSMTMLQGYAHMVDFFTSFDWWMADPHDEMVTGGNDCLADPGKVYAIYMPHGGKTTVHLVAGDYDASWFNPRTGERTGLPAARGPVWTSPVAGDEGDWAILLTKRK